MATSRARPALPDFGDVRLAYVVLDFDGPVEALARALPRLAAQLTRRVERPRVRSQQLRGRVDWSATVRARLAPPPDPYRRVVRPTERDHDTLENQLLATVLDRVVGVLDRIPPSIRAGSLWDLGASWFSTADAIGQLRAVLSERQLGVRLRRVTRPSLIDRRWTDAARAADVREYREVARVHDALVDAARSWERLTPRVRILPFTADDAANPWIAAAAML
jgi:hypothetical protein